jgi:thymidylate synthase ThyX
MKKERICIDFNFPGPFDCNRLFFEVFFLFWAKKGAIRMSQDFEEFTEDQKKILNRFVSNTSGNIFVLRNLPEVIKGALFSRYSRSPLGLRSLLLKEFILNKDAAFSSIADKDFSSEINEKEEQIIATQKAQNFYDRILDGYGDDSIAELGGAHLAIENISLIAAKAIEDNRIGGSPLEKSTRYIYFDQKVKDEYLYYREPILMTSAWRDLYVQTCNRLFDTYSQLIPLLTAQMEKKFPKETHLSGVAYTAALRAKVLDCLRGLLPASCYTNLGLFGNGRFFEQVLRKLNAHNLSELQEISKESLSELTKVIPSFVKRADPLGKYQQSYLAFSSQMQEDLNLLAKDFEWKKTFRKESGVFLHSYDPDAVVKVAGALLFEHTDASLEDLWKYVRELSEEELLRILDAAALSRENRRHKSPRALEFAAFTFEIVSDFGTYRDLQRHRMLTQERQLLTCNYGYFIPREILGTAMEKEYVFAMEEAKKTFDLIAKEFPEEAQYVVPQAFHLRWYFHVNLRSLQWLCELRSAPQGHSNYRHVAQEMVRLVCQAFPPFERFFKFVDFDGYELGRMGQELKRVERKVQA